VKRSARWKALWIAMGLTGGVWAAFAAAQSRAPDTTAVATVGPLRVSRAEFQQRADATLNNYRQRSGTALPDEVVPIVRRQVLESLIRMDLLMLEAERRGTLGSQAEAESQIKRDPFFNPGGTFDPAKFAAVKAANTPAWQSALLELRRRQGAQQLETKLEAERGPSEPALRRSAERALSRGAFDYLLMRQAEFDGNFAEPREREILDYYRSHPSEFQRPERATLSVLFVDKPAPGDAERGNPSAMAAWTARHRQSADSLLAALKGGASFDAAADSIGGAHRNVVITRDNLPGFWHGTAAQVEAVFRQKPGSVLPEIVPSPPGFLIARVENIRPAAVTPLVEVSKLIRQRLRNDARAHGEERDLRPLYTEFADSLRGPGVRVRYAVADTSTLEAGTPTDADLDRYYRGHLADYSRFDAATGAIVATPFADVSDDVRARWARDRRVEAARGIVEGLVRAWSAGRRDPALEKAASLLREVGPVPVGALVDTGAAGRVVSDSLRLRGPERAAVVAPFRGGSIVYQVVSRVPDWKPTFEQALPRLRQIYAQRRSHADEAAAHAWFDRDPAAFARGNVVHFSRVIVSPMDALSVPLTRAEVERYHRKHFDRYSAAEVVGARHILISPTGPGPRADQEARARADSVYRVVVGGADFGQVADRISDDPATRGKGGDLGDFGRGAMLDEFERAVFAMQPGDVSRPVKTEVGYHIIKCTKHLPVKADPLKYIYATVGYDCALEKADSLAAQRADSLYRRARTAAQVRAGARKLGLEVISNTQSVGQQVLVPDLVPYFHWIETHKAGELYPGTIYLKGIGGVLTWIDSIGPPHRPEWAEVREQVIDLYRQGASTRAAFAKCAELDSMMAAGWSLDSLGTLWGGMAHAPSVSPAIEVQDLGGGKDLVDSLLFGARGGRALKEGETSGWLVFPSGPARMRLLARLDPNPGQLAARIENDRRLGMERNLRTYFEELKDRYPVRILDTQLRDVGLPPPPPPTD